MPTFNQLVRKGREMSVNKNAQDLLMGAPGEVTQKQLDELRIEVKKDKKTEKE